MKLTDSLYYFLPVMMGAAGLVASIAFGSVDTETVSSGQPASAHRAADFVYLPAQYTPRAPDPVEERAYAF
jgi:hypothetical protein